MIKNTEFQCRNSTAGGSQPVLQLQPPPDGDQGLHRHGMQVNPCACSFVSSCFAAISSHCLGSPRLEFAPSCPVHVTRVLRVVIVWNHDGLLTIVPLDPKGEYKDKSKYAAVPPAACHHVT